MRQEMAKFQLGRTVITSGALSSLDPEDVLRGLRRHATGDWGDCERMDWEENDYSVEAGLRIVSVYQDRNDTKFWVITEADRSATTILLPSEY